MTKEEKHLAQDGINYGCYVRSICNCGTVVCLRCIIANYKRKNIYVAENKWTRSLELFLEISWFIFLAALRSP